MTVHHRGRHRRSARDGGRFPQLTPGGMAVVLIAFVLAFAAPFVIEAGLG